MTAVAPVMRKPSPAWDPVEVGWCGTLMTGEPAEGVIRLQRVESIPALDLSSAKPVGIYNTKAPLEFPLRRELMDFHDGAGARYAGVVTVKLPGLDVDVANSDVYWRCDVDLVDGSGGDPIFFRPQDSSGGTLWLNLLQASASGSPARPNPEVARAEFTALKVEVQALVRNGITAAAGYVDTIKDIIGATLSGPGVHYDESRRVVTLSADPQAVVDSMTLALLGDDLITWRRVGSNIKADTSVLKGQLASKATTTYVDTAIATVGRSGFSNMRAIPVNADGTWPSTATLGQPSRENVYLFYVPKQLVGTRTTWLAPPVSEGAFVIWDASIRASAAPVQSPPKVSASVQSQSDKQVTFTAAAQLASGTVSKLEWLFSDGASLTGQTVTHAFTGYGSVWGRVTITTDGGFTATSQVSTAVAAAAPDVSLTASVGSDGMTIVWTATAADAALYEWAGTDGLAGATATVQKTYASTGAKTATVKVTKTSGATASQAAGVTLNGTPAPPQPGDAVPAPVATAPWVADSFATASSTPLTRATDPGTLAQIPATLPVGGSATGMTVSGGQLRMSGAAEILYANPSAHRSVRGTATLLGTNTSSYAQIILRRSEFDEWLSATMKTDGSIIAENKTNSGGTYTSADLAPAGSWMNGDRISAKFVETDPATGAGVMTVELSRNGTLMGTWSATLTPDARAVASFGVKQGNFWDSAAQATWDDLVFEPAVAGFAAPTTPPRPGGSALTPVLPPVAGGGSIRRTYTATPAAGGSMYDAYHSIFGNSQFCAPVGAAPDWKPSDRYAAGRKLKTVAANWPNIDVKGHALRPYVVDTRLPEGPTSSGGGGYTWQKVYQANGDAAWRDMRGRGGPYELEMDRVAIPVGFRGSGGVDAAASVYDVGQDKLQEYAVVQQQTSTSNLKSGVSGAALPVGAYLVNTCGVSYDVKSGDGGFQYGGVVAAALWGAGVQIGIKEALAASGLRQNTDGTFTETTPVVDAIQHAIGVEVPAWLTEGSATLYSKPARASDAVNAVTAGMMHGQRLQLDPNFSYSETGLSNLAKALCWTLKNYGAFVTGRSDSCLTVRGEEWVNPGHGQDPWLKIGRTSNAQWDSTFWIPLFSSIPWEGVRSVVKDWIGAPIGRP